MTLREAVLVGVGIGLGFAAATQLVTYLLREFNAFLISVSRTLKYRSLGVAPSVVLEHGSRMDTRTPWYACRRHCVICDDLGLPCREDMGTVAVAPPEG